MNNQEVGSTNLDTLRENKSKAKPEDLIKPLTFKTNDNNDCESTVTKTNVIPEQHSSIVASHYNRIEEKGLKERYNSPIFYLRNFNNWVKSTLIVDYLNKIREQNHGRPLKILDICCGKGGDISKWLISNVDYVVFADIAEVSIQQCRNRYEGLNTSRRRCFSAEFIVADCTKVCLREMYRNPSIRFDMVSCQFGLHYSFESLSQARRMLLNISESLRPGGYFIGTIPNAYEIVTRAQNSPNKQFGNKIFNIKLLFDPNDEGYPLFGGKYDFQLEGVVDCPEFLVYVKLLYELASECDLEVVYEASFEKFYRDHLDDHMQLLRKTRSLESYPAPPGKNLLGDEDEYKHVEAFLENPNRINKHDKIGTMTKSQWEVATIYMAFAMQKSQKKEE